MIHCLPDDVAVDVSAAETVLAGLLRDGVTIAHACGGNAACSTCRVQVLDGLGACLPRNEAEGRMAARLRFPDDIRLACQTRVRGDVRLRRLVLDDADLALASQIGPGAPATVGREQFVVVLFADIARFTALSEALPAYDIVHLLNRYYAAAGEAVGRHAGSIVNYMGDGFMALFAPAAQAARAEAAGGSTDSTDSADSAADSDAERMEAEAARAAVRAGLEVLAAANEVDARFVEAYGCRLEVRVGIHCGEAVVGHVGVPGERHETAIGDTVNVASRIEAANKETGTRLLVSDEVLARLGADARVGGSFRIGVRGKSAPVAMHEIVGWGA